MTSPKRSCRSGSVPIRRIRKSRRGCSAAPAADGGCSHEPDADGNSGSHAVVLARIRWCSVGGRPPRKLLPPLSHPPRPSPTRSSRPPQARTCSARRWPVSSSPGSGAIWRSESRCWRRTLDALAASATAKAELIDPIDLDRQLWALHRAATTTVDDLGAIVRRLEHDGNALESEARKWQERRLFLETRLVPAPVLERARSIEAKLQDTSGRLREFRDSALLALDRALALQARIDGARALIAAQQERVRSHRMEVEKSPIWQLGAAPAQFEHVAAELRAAWRVLRDYLVQDGAGLAGLFLGVLALTGWLFTRGGRQDAGSAQRAYGRPVAASLLIALMSLWWLAPDPPILFYEALLVLVPIPAAMVARRALAAPIPLTLYGLAFATMLIPLRGVDRRERDCQSGAAAAASDLRRRSGRHRPAPWAVAAGIAALEPGRRARCGVGW